MLSSTGTSAIGVVVGRQLAGAVPWKTLSLSKCATNGELFLDFCRMAFDGCRTETIRYGPM